MKYSKSTCVAKVTLLMGLAGAGMPTVPLPNTSFGNANMMLRKLKNLGFNQRWQDCLVDCV